MFRITSIKCEQQNARAFWSEDILMIALAHRIAQKCSATFILHSLLHRVCFYLAASSSLVELKFTVSSILHSTWQSSTLH
jgi:hypothetical protein